MELQNKFIKDSFKNKDAFDEIDEMKSAIYQMKINKIPEVLTLKELIAELHKVFDSANVNVEYVQSLMTTYKSDPSEWRKFAKFDRYRYTRNLVDEGNGKFNLMVLCWNEGQGSAIHDHANAHCFMKILQGELIESRFHWPKEEPDAGVQEVMEVVSRSTLSKDSVCYINDSIGLHRVENPSHSDVTVSLHLYSPPYDSCSVFNQNTGQRSTAQATFWSIYGHRKNKDSAEEDN